MRATGKEKKPPYGLPKGRARPFKFNPSLTFRYRVANSAATACDGCAHYWDKNGHLWTVTDSNGWCDELERNVGAGSRL